MDRVSGRLTVFFEDPFWVGVFERIENRKLSVAKVTFGAEPKDYEVLAREYYNEIEKTLIRLLSDQPIVRISHIGSTAIQGIWAKNIIDVMIEIPQSADMKDMAQIFKQNDFIIMSSEENRISLNKGYTANGRQKHEGNMEIDTNKFFRLNRNKIKRKGSYCYNSSCFFV